MQSVFLPLEEDFKRWIKDAVRTALKEELPATLKDLQQKADLNNEPLLTRKEIASYLRVSLVTLNDYVKRGLPSHKKRGGRRFLKSEIVQWVKENR